MLGAQALYEKILRSNQEKQNDSKKAQKEQIQNLSKSSDMHILQGTRSSLTYQKNSIKHQALDNLNNYLTNETINKIKKLNESENASLTYRKNIKNPYDPRGNANKLATRLTPFKEYAKDLKPPKPRNGVVPTPLSLVGMQKLTLEKYKNFFKLMSSNQK